MKSGSVACGGGIFIRLLMFPVRSDVVDAMREASFVWAFADDTLDQVARVVAPLGVEMVIRVATFNEKPAVHSDEALMATFRDWMKSQPGFVAAWHAASSKTGKAQSISVWTDMASLMAMKDRVFPGPPMGLKPDLVDVFDDVEAF